MDQLRIKTKKDWCIAFIFLILAVYGITRRFSTTLQSCLLNYGNPRLAELNQPKSYGNFIVTACVMTLLIEVLLFLYHKSLKVKLISIIAGIVCTGVIFAGYLINCNLIVSVIQVDSPICVQANYLATNKHIKIDEAKKKRQLISYCETLKPVSNEKEKELEELFYNSDSNITANSLFILLIYPERYGHNYNLIVNVYHDMIFISKGYNNHQKEIVTFFQDNGLLDLINEMKK